VVHTMNNPTIRHIAIFEVLVVAIIFSMGVALADEDIFSYQGDYQIDTAKLNGDENAAYPYVQKYAEERHISPALLMAMVKQESGFNPNAIGDGGLAIGYMQVHWDAAYDAGYRSARGGSTEDQKKLYAKEDWPTDGLNPDTNMKYGSGYLKIVYDQWKDSSVYNDPVKNAISAFNKGRTLGPDLSNQASYVDPILTYYENYISKYVANPTSATATQVFQWPVDSNDRVAVCYSYNINCYGIITGHTGIDISPNSDNSNPPIRAVAFGKISKVVKNDIGCASNCEGSGKGCSDHGFGNTVIIEHGLENGDTVYSMYAHLDSIKDGIKIGVTVNAGEPIGIMGASGYGQKDYWVNPCTENDNPHLHFEIKDGNTLLNPSGKCTDCIFGYADGNPDDYGYHNPEDYFGNNKYKVLCSVKSLWEFNTPGDNEGWSHHNIDAWSVETDGKFRIDPGPTDPWIDQPYISLDSTFYNAVNINMASNAPDGVGAIYFTTSDSSEFSEDKKVDFDINNDGKWHDDSIFMGSQPMWTGTITGIRIDPANNGREEGEVDSIGFDYIRVEHSHIILDQSVYPNVVSAGDELTFVFNIDNQFSNEISKVRLGARIRTHDPQGEWIDDMSNDNTITLKPGANDYSRVFKTPVDLSDGLYDAEWVVMDEGTKRWIDHEDMCPILTISSGSTPNPTPTSQPTSPPTAVQTGAESPTPTGDTEENNVIEVITSVIKETINKILDLLDKLL